MKYNLLNRKEKSSELLISHVNPFSFYTEKLQPPYSQVSENEEKEIIKTSYENKLFYRKRLKELDTFINEKLMILLNRNLNSIYVNKINIRFAFNNIFGTYSSTLASGIKKSISAGSLKLLASRKMKKHNFRGFLTKFTYILLKCLKKKDFFYLDTVLTVIAKKRFRKKIKAEFYYLSQNNHLEKDINFLYIIRPKKCFNGCRAPKKRRKKRIKFRIFK
jgi:hypothetical protein